MMRKLFFLCLCLFAIACNVPNEVVAPNQSRISLSVRNLPPLEAGHYQLWTTFFNFNKSNEGDSPTHEGEFVSLGEFKVMEDGTLRNPHGGEARFGLPAGENPELLKDIVIAVQADHDDSFAKPLDDEPGSILLGGAFHGDATTAAADMNIAYADAFKTTFASVTGKCTITCPTSPADSNYGIWFVNVGSTISAGLQNLPTLPAQWRYEGWVVSGEQFYSTGKFARADSADYDGAGPQKGPDTPLSFPGQDFVTGPVRPVLVSTGFTFMVTVEPQPDNSPNPFFFKVLTAQSGGRSVNFQNVAANLAPTARVIIER